jgi:hypothetical protein
LTPIVDRSELVQIINEIRVKMIMKGIKSVDEEIFDGFNSEDTITIHELERMFKRQPFELDALKLARYLIEPRKESMIRFNKLREEKIKAIKLKTIIGEYIIFDKELKHKLWEGIIEVILLSYIIEI